MTGIDGPIKQLNQEEQDILTNSHLSGIRIGMRLAASIATNFNAAGVPIGEAIEKEAFEKYCPKFDHKDKSTWPKDCQDVQVHSSEFGFAHATFYEKDFDHEGPGFGNWNDRSSEDEDADYMIILGDIHWWPLPDLTNL